MIKINLEKKAKTIRADILKMIYTAQSGHPGGSLSCVEILMSLYYGVANVSAEQVDDNDRDLVVLSKGHACPALYAILADKGYFPKKDLEKFRQIDSHLQGHPDMRKTPGVDASTGSLGQGISIAVGMAMASKHQGKKNKVYAIVGDGELQEGLVWEAAMSAAHYELDNLVVLLDYNGLQIDGSNEEVMKLGNVNKKFDSFGFECLTVDGHDVDAIQDAIKLETQGKPKFICCRTFKGKGVSFMENEYGWHGKAPNEEQYHAALKELGVSIDG